MNTQSIYKLIAYKFKHGDDLTDYERELVFDSADNYGFDPYNVPTFFLARNMEAFDNELF